MPGSKNLFDTPMPNSQFEAMVGQMGTEVEQPVGKRVQASASEDYGVLRKFPKELVGVARAKFPTAKTNTDAIVAYMCCYCPDIVVNNNLKSSLTQDQLDLMKGFEGNDYKDIAERLLAIKKKMDNQQADIDFLKTVVTFLVFDRQGQTDGEDNASSYPGYKGWNPFERNAKFLPFVRQIEQAQKSYQQDREKKDGRPLNF